MEKQSPNIFHLTFYINGDISTSYRYGLDYAPFKMAYFEFENYHYLIVSGNDAQLHIYKINLEDLPVKTPDDKPGFKIQVEDAAAKFF